MFRILEIKQQIFPMERISSHTSPLHLRQELSLKWAHVNATDARCFATKPRQLRTPPPLLIPSGVHAFLFLLLFLWENRLGLWIRSRSDPLPAVSRGGTPAWARQLPALTELSETRRHAAPRQDLCHRPARGQTSSITEIARWHKIAG